MAAQPTAEHYIIIRLLRALVRASPRDNVLNIPDCAKAVNWMIGALGLKGLEDAIDALDPARSAEHYALQRSIHAATRLDVPEECLVMSAQLADQLYDGMGQT